MKFLKSWTNYYICHSTSAFAGHHEMSEPAIKYVLTQGFKTTNAPATTRQQTNSFSRACWVKEV